MRRRWLVFERVSACALLLLLPPEAGSAGSQSSDSLFCEARIPGLASSLVIAVSCLWNSLSLTSQFIDVSAIEYACTSHQHTCRLVTSGRLLNFTLAKAA